MKVLLTDFNLPKWEVYDRRSIKLSINNLKDSILFSELYHPINEEKYDNISEDRIVIKITNIYLDENEYKCYGDIEFVNETDKNRDCLIKAKEVFNNNNARFSIRARITEINQKTKFSNIITWDLVRKWN